MQEIIIGKGSKYGTSKRFSKRLVLIENLQDGQILPYLDYDRSSGDRKKTEIEELHKYFNLFKKYTMLHDIFNWPKNYQVYFQEMADELNAQLLEKGLYTEETKYTADIVKTKITNRIDKYHTNTMRNMPYAYSKELAFLNQYLFDGKYVVKTGKSISCRRRNPRPLKQVQDPPMVQDPSMVQDSPMVQDPSMVQDSPIQEPPIQQFQVPQISPLQQVQESSIQFNNKVNVEYNSDAADRPILKVKIQVVFGNSSNINSESSSGSGISTE